MKYSFLMRFNHWVLTIFIFGQIGMGYYMKLLPDHYPDKYTFYAYHKEFGVLIAILMIFRILVRANSKVPTLPKIIGKYDKMVSSITILSLYLLVFTVAFSGCLMSSFGGHPIVFFGYTLPNPYPLDKELATFFSDTHTVSAVTLVTLVSLHILGWAKHYMFERVNLLNRIW